MKKVAIFLVVLSLCLCAFYAYTQFSAQSVIIIDKETGEASEIKINLNIKTDKQESIEETPEVKIDEKTEQDIEEELREIDSGDEVIVKKVYTDFDILNYISNDKNYMVSPFSLKVAMMMAANGAESKTQKEILEAFGVEDIQEYNQKIEEVMTRYNNTEEVKLNVANSIWLNKDIVLRILFNDEYKDIIEKYYKGDAKEVTIEDAISSINAWVEEKTEGKINNLITDPNFLSVLINTVYFKGAWVEQFDDYLTEKDTFTDVKGAEVEKDFMNKTGRFNYFQDDTMQMLKLPYLGSKISMYVVIPKTEGDLDFNNAINNMTSKKINVTIPKFKVEYSIVLNDILNQMGIEVAFTEDANFYKMFTSETKDIFYISQVLQKTFIEVDENGTEAAAATAIILKNSAYMPQPEEIVDFIANKPFIYFIRDDETGEVLFLGKILY